MRLLIYLLAMLTGFSAAEASRPVTVAPAALGSSVSPTAIVAASVVRVEFYHKSHHDFVDMDLVARPILPFYSSDDAHIVPTPVTAHDVSRQ
jgi:hypothetical protein